MSISPALPASLHAKLAQLTGHLRFWRMVRGASCLVLLLATTFLAVGLLDLWLELSDAVLGTLLAVLLGTAGLLAVTTLLLPWLRRPDLIALAAVIEQHYPELAERLTSSVELSAAADEMHGAQSLIAELLRETAQQARPLSFTHAVSTRTAKQLAGAAGVVFLLALLPAVVWAEAYLDFSERFLLAWFGPQKLYFTVQPGTRVAALEQPVEFEVTIRRRNERVAWPTNVTLVWTTATGELARQRMQEQAQDTFSFTLPRLAGDLQYHIEANRSTSDQHLLTAVPLPQLASQYPVLTVQPPNYVNADIHPRQDFSAPSQLSVLQYSKVALLLQLVQPALKGQVTIAVIQADGALGASWQLPLAMAERGTRSALDLPALSPGQYKLELRLETTGGLATTLALPELAVWADQAPYFVELPSVLRERDASAPAQQPRGELTDLRVTPTDLLRLLAVVEDKVGVDKLEAEYRINAGPAQFETLVDAKGLTVARSEHRFTFRGKVKDNDVVQLRLKASDNRALAAAVLRDERGKMVPGQALTPHVIYHPTPVDGKERWFKLRVDATAEPLHQAEINKERERIKSLLEAILTKLRDERDGVQSLTKDSQGLPSLIPEKHGKALDGLRSAHRDNQRAVGELGKLIGATPELQKLREKVDAVAAAELPRAGDALKNALDARNEPPARHAQFTQADNELQAAIKKLSDLVDVNNKLAEDRKAQLRLEQLAEQEQELSRRAAELAKKDLENDPKAKAELDKLSDDQKKIADELKKEAEKQGILRDASEQAKAERAKQIGDKSTELALKQQELAKDTSRVVKDAMKDHYKDFIKEQQALALRAGDLSRQTAKTAAAAASQPLDARPPQHATDALKEGEVGKAVAKQEQTIQELLRLARDLDFLPNLGDDIGANVRELQRAQEELARRMEQLGERLPQLINQPQLLNQALREIAQNQKKLITAMNDLKLPFDNQNNQRARQEARESAEEVLEQFRQANTLEAWNAMKRAGEALGGLAAQYPNDPRKAEIARQATERRQQQLAVARLAAEQQKLADATSQPGTDPAALADRQFELTRQLAGLQLPHSEARQEAAVKAMDDAQRVLVNAAKPSEGKDAADRAAKAVANLAKDLAGDASMGERLAKDQSQELRQLAKDQLDLRNRLQQYAAATKPASPDLGKLAERQDKMKQEVKELQKELAPLAKMTDNPHAKQDVEKARQALEKAKEKMEQAKEQAKQGDGMGAEKSSDEAAEELGKAAKSAGEGAKKLTDGEMKGKPEPSAMAPEAGKDLQEGQKEIANAEMKLAQPDAKSAEKSMEKAAKALQQAASKLSKQMADSSGGPPSNMLSPKGGNPGPSPVDLKQYGSDMAKYEGKSWGELPGELRNRIVQDLRTRYGADYAGIVQRYFEQIAESPSRP